MSILAHEWTPSWDKQPVVRDLKSAIQHGEFKEARDIAAKIAKEKLEDVAETLQGGMHQTKEKLGDVAGKVQDSLYHTKDKIVDGLGSTKDKLADGAAFAKDTIVGGLGTTKDKIAGSAQFAKDKIVDGLGTTKDKIAGTAQLAKDKLADGFDATKERLAEGFDNTKESLEDSIRAGETYVKRLQPYFSWFGTDSLLSHLSSMFSIVFFANMAFGFVPHMLFGTSKQRHFLTACTMLFATCFSYVTAQHHSIRNSLLAFCYTLIAIKTLCISITKTSGGMFIGPKNIMAKFMYWSYNSIALFLRLIPLGIACGNSVTRTADNAAISWFWSWFTDSKKYVLENTFGSFEYAALACFAAVFCYEVYVDFYKNREKGASATFNANEHHLTQLSIFFALSCMALRGSHGYRFFSFLCPLIPSLPYVINRYFPKSHLAKMVYKFGI